MLLHSCSLKCRREKQNTSSNPKWECISLGIWIESYCSRSPHHGLQVVTSPASPPMTIPVTHRASEGLASLMLLQHSRLFPLPALFSPQIPGILQVFLKCHRCKEKKGDTSPHIYHPLIYHTIYIYLLIYCLFLSQISFKRAAIFVLFIDVYPKRLEQYLAQNRSSKILSEWMNLTVKLQEESKKEWKG